MTWVIKWLFLYIKLYQKICLQSSTHVVQQKKHTKQNKKPNNKQFTLSKVSLLKFFKIQTKPKIVAILKVAGNVEIKHFFLFLLIISVVVYQGPWYTWAVSHSPTEPTQPVFQEHEQLSNHHGKDVAIAIPFCCKYHQEPAERLSWHCPWCKNNNN